MSGVAYPGVTLAEVYVMRKQHKENLKKFMMEKEKADNRKLESSGRDEEIMIKNNSSNGCFFKMFKKTTAHSSKVSSFDCA